jgi:nucleoid DNA-binding protein
MNNLKLEMDIDLFSDIVKNLILDNDEVTLPGVGTFVSELVPSSFSDKGYTINPPYRRLSFRQRWNEEDDMLVRFYSETNGTDPETSRRILTDFLNGLRETLQSKKVVPMPGLGRLRATKENTFFFIADEDLDIYPYGYGLEPVSLKTHEETPEEVAAAVQDLQEIVESAPVEAVEPEEAFVREEPVRTKGPVNWAFVIPLFIVCAVALFFIVFFIMVKFTPGLLDSILYSPEELRIINHPLS